MNNYDVSFSTSKSIKYYTFRNPLLQYFSFSYPIIKYIIQNPQSPRAWKNLLRTCKYFYSKNSILPVSDIHWMSELLTPKCYADNEFIDLSIALLKLWVSDSFRAFIGSSNKAVSSIIPKIYKCRLRSLTIAFQNLTFDDYQELTSSGTVKFLGIWSCKIKNADHSTVTFDKLLENLCQINVFQMSCTKNSLMFQSDTVKKMNEHLTKFNNLSFFGLYVIPESFYFVSFKDFLMKNTTVLFQLKLSSRVSDAYKEMVKNIIKEIKENPLLKVPDLHM